MNREKIFMSQPNKLHGSQHRGLIRILICCIAILLSGGCATKYSPRADLSTVETIGVVVPTGSTEPENAEDFLEVYKLTAGEGQLRNTAAGAGKGAILGTAAGAGAGAILGCSAAAMVAPVCWAAVLTAGAVMGGTTGAVIGANADPEKPIESAPVHLYEVNQVLPDITQRYLANEALESRALTIMRNQGTPIQFVPATWNGERYVESPDEKSMPAASATNLVLSEMTISISGKAKEDPKLRFIVYMQWALTKYNPETNDDEIWDLMSSSYTSKQHKLSQWMENNGALLKHEVDSGLTTTLAESMSVLPTMTKR